MARGRGRTARSAYFSCGTWGLLVNILAVAYGALVALNIAWPRNSIYNAVGTPHWYWQWSPFLFIGGVVIIGTLYYFLVQVTKSPDVLEEHRASIPDLPGEHIALWRSGAVIRTGHN